MTLLSGLFGFHEVNGPRISQVFVVDIQKLPNCPMLYQPASQRLALAASRTFEKNCPCYLLSETVRLVLASLGYLLFGFGATLLNTAPWLVRSARRQWVSFWRDWWNFNELNLEKCVKQACGQRALVCRGRFEPRIISHQKQATQVGLLAAVRVAPSQHSGKAAACVLCSNLSCSLHIHNAAVIIW